MNNNKRIVCKNGVSLSVQASEFHYCKPRNSGAFQYTHCEVGYIEGCKSPDYLSPFGDYNGEDDPVVFGYVPVELVERFIQENGGIDLGLMLGGGGFVSPSL